MTATKEQPRRGEGAVRRRPNQCAQHYRLPPKVSQELTTRQQAIPQAHRRAVQELSWRCQNRLHERGRKLAARGKTRQKVQVALARELAAFDSVASSGSFTPALRFGAAPSSQSVSRLPPPLGCVGSHAPDHAPGRRQPRHPHAPARETKRQDHQQGRTRSEEEGPQLCPEEQSRSHAYGVSESTDRLKRITKN